MPDKTLDFTEYQQLAHGTALPIDGTLLTAHQIYASLGLSNEAGEVVGLIKKALRGDYGQNPAESTEFKNKLNGEVGDVLWYLSELSTQFNLNLEFIAIANLEKLKSRQNRGVLQGDGGDR
jgi:NTP pyrophosphatase (non-canonical NTP hydrolase)